jgi:hypothetical protein
LSCDISVWLHTAQIKLRGDYTSAPEDTIPYKERHSNYYPKPDTQYPHFKAQAGAASLYDLVAHGAQHRVQASRIVNAFCDELQQIDEYVHRVMHLHTDVSVWILYFLAFPPSISSSQLSMCAGSPCWWRSTASTHSTTRPDTCTRRRESRFR